LRHDGIEVAAATEESVPDGIRRCPTTELPALLRWADVGVLSGGVLKYEAAAASLPVLLVSVVAHQAAVAEGFARCGAGVYLGDAADIEPSMLLAEVRALLSDAAAREALGARAHALVDGRGVERVAEAALASSPGATIEPA
jgi:spore coat polysaccharide biosynthesis predicted glycosyltransferase SpsG